MIKYRTIRNTVMRAPWYKRIDWMVVSAYLILFAIVIGVVVALTY